jgi:hypothetical protein
VEAPRVKRPRQIQIYSMAHGDETPVFLSRLKLAGSADGVLVNCQLCHFVLVLVLVLFLVIDLPLVFKGRERG